LRDQVWKPSNIFTYKYWSPQHTQEGTILKGKKTQENLTLNLNLSLTKQLPHPSLATAPSSLLWSQSRVVAHPPAISLPSHYRTPALPFPGPPSQLFPSIDPPLGQKKKPRPTPHFLLFSLEPTEKKTTPPSFSHRPASTFSQFPYTLASTDQPRPLPHSPLSQSSPSAAASPTDPDLSTTPSSSTLSAAPVSAKPRPVSCRPGFYCSWDATAPPVDLQPDPTPPPCWQLYPKQRRRRRNP